MVNLNKLNGIKSIEDLRKFAYSQIKNKDVEIFAKNSNRNVSDKGIGSKKTKINNSKNLSKNNDSVEVGHHKIYGKYIAIDGVTISIDCWDPNADFVYVSHAHMDHIPILPKNFTEKLKKKENYPKFLCSAITKDIAELRTRGSFTIPEKTWFLGREMKWNEKISTTYKDIEITLFPNGHAYGSTSLFIEGTRTIFYTGDFITENKDFPHGGTKMKRLKPIKCDFLVSECTYGDPRYVFPSFPQIRQKIITYIDRSISKDNPVVLLGYVYGKSQALLNMINPEHTVILDKNIAAIVQALRKHGIKFNEWEPYGNFNKRALAQRTDYVLIVPPYLIFHQPYNYLRTRGAKVLYATGKVLNDSDRQIFSADENIPYSDHADFNQLVEFVKACEPEKIWLHHGCVEALSYYLRRSEGFDDIQFL